MTTENRAAPATKGLVMHSEARYYDLLAWLLTLGRERPFRERLVGLARLATGESVLDVGCGTGTLAIAAKRRVGPSGTVHAIDASPEMIARATRKAERARADVRFQTGVVEALPFPDASFDAALSTLMLHHLPRPVRRECAREIRRVLKPGGRGLAVDFGTPTRARTGPLARLHRHGHLAPSDITELLTEAGLRVVERGSVGVSDLHFVVAQAPSSSDADRRNADPAFTSLAPLPAPRWLFVLLAVVVLAGHAAVVRVGGSRAALPAFAVAAIGVLLVAAHLRVAGLVHGVLRRRRSR